MDQALKNRLVGVGVLMAIAVVVLPLLFDGANQQALLADTRMPPAPEMPEPAALLAEPPAQLPEAEEEITRDHMPAEPEPMPVVAPVAVAPSAAVAETPVVPAAAPAAAPAADARLAAMAEAWHVQVAAVSAVDGAERLRGKLQQAGYKARIVKIDGLYKVVVGPELRREDAEALRATLAGDARVGKPDGRLVRYVP